MFRLTLLLLFVPQLLIAATPFQFGTAKRKITPEEPLWMAGYAARKTPATGTIHDLWVKAVAIQAGDDLPLIVLTSDLCGIPRNVAETVCAEVSKKTKLPRDRILLTCSHTHSGPVVDGNLTDMYDLTPEQPERIKKYTQKLESMMIDTILDSMKTMKPGKLSVGKGTARFAKNRREFKGENVILGVNGEGPVDHDVPVMKIEDESGKIRAILFGYACHNTTLDLMEWNGDYAGFAQIEIEKKFPDALALFWIGCGADANPNPRRKLEQAQQYGKELAEAVEGVLKQSLTELSGKIASQYTEIALPFAEIPGREKWLMDSMSKTTAVRNRATKMLKHLETGKIPDTYPHYPIQVIRIGDSFLWVALGGEVVIDYNLRLKRESKFTGTFWITGYANDVMSYIPSARILKEGGYEADSSQIYYGMPTKYHPKIEELIMTKTKELINKR